LSRTRWPNEQVWYALTRTLSEEEALVEDLVTSSLSDAPSPQYLKEQLECLQQQQADLVDAVATVGGKKAMQDVLLLKLEAVTTELEAVRKMWEEQDSQRIKYATIERSRYRGL
jgi:hypothetical protein